MAEEKNITISDYNVFRVKSAINEQKLFLHRVAMTECNPLIRVISVRTQGMHN